MVSSEKRRIADNRSDQLSDGEESVDVSMDGVEAPVSANPSISRRLTEIFLEDGDEHLLLQRSDKKDGFLQWLQALDVQVMGACRADERLKPLLKINISSGEAEDRLLTQLIEHFEPSEVGLLARCLCVPLVSVRVGKINKQGTLLSPTPIRGNLCLVLLPTSDLCISFHGDDGSMERLVTLRSEAQCTAIEIEEISADKSGRSFLIKTTDGVVYYFWCSERSQLLGNELLRKMKDLLTRRPSLAELTGIREGRLISFATHLRTYLGGATVVSAYSSDVLSASVPAFDDTIIHFPRTPFTSENSSCLLRSSSNKGPPESSSYSKVTPAQNLVLGRENNVVHVDSLPLASINSGDPSDSNSFQKVLEINGMHPLATLSFIDACDKPPELPHSGPNVQLPPSALFHFSTLEDKLVTSQLPILSTESLPLPPLSTLLSAARSKSPVNLTEVPPVNFPSFLPDPLIRLPTSAQIPTFTPLMCDPIVHIPMIDVCSSGQGYLVSAGPGIAPTIPPLNPNLVNPLFTDAESLVEKSARETLRMLISSTSQPSPQLLEVLPYVFGSSNDDQNVIGNGDVSVDKKESPSNSGFDARMG